MYINIIWNRYSYWYNKRNFALFFRKQALPTIFDYRPKYGIYEEQILTDNETTGLEDWFAVNIIDLYWK